MLFPDQLVHKMLNYRMEDIADLNVFTTEQAE